MLKLFGIGATIVPVVDGMPKTEAPASLIKVPEVQLVPPPVPLVYGEEHLRSAFFDRELVTISVRISSKRGYTDFVADTFVTSTVQSYVDAMSWGDTFRKTLPGPSDTKWEVTGRIIN